MHLGLRVYFRLAQAVISYSVVDAPRSSSSSAAVKLVEGAQKSWRRIDGPNQLPKLIQNVKFADGIEVTGNSAVAQAQAAA
jgi:hypothetical protein